MAERKMLAGRVLLVRRLPLHSLVRRSRLRYFKAARWFCSPSSA